MNLYLVELTRMRWRRAVVALVLLAAALGILIVSVLGWNTRPLSDADRARVDAELVQLAEQSRREFDTMMADCTAHPENFGFDDPSLCEPNLGEYHEPTAEWIGERPELGGAMAVESGTAVAVLAILLALLLGTTYAGADWNTGSMSNQLLFRPRRLQVWLAKAGAALTAGVLLGAVAAGLYWGVIAVLDASRGLDLSSGYEGEGSYRAAAVGLALRGVAFAAGAALLGCGLAMLLRSTVATLGILLGAGVGSMILFNTLPIDGLKRWTLDLQLMAVLRDGWQAEVYQDVCTNDLCFEIIKVSLLQGTLYFGGILGVVLLLSALAFRRRDVP